MARQRPVGRPRQGGKGRHTRLYTLKAVTIDNKLCVLAFLKNADMRATIEHFYGALASGPYQSKRTQIQRWKREDTKFQAAAKQHKGAHRKVNDLRAEGVPVSPRMLAFRAREVATAASVQDFSASDSWITGFKARHKFSMRSSTRQGQTSPEDIDAVAQAFAIEVEMTVRELGISRVFNADQTAVFFEYVPKKTLNSKGQKTVWVKCEGASKERATVVLLGDSDGVRYTPFVVFKMTPAKQASAVQENQAGRCGFGSGRGQKFEPFAAKQRWKFTQIRKDGGIRLSLVFLEHHFANRLSPDEPILLLWDDFSGHWTDVVRQSTWFCSECHEARRLSVSRQTSRGITRSSLICVVAGSTTCRHKSSSTEGERSASN